MKILNYNFSISRACFFAKNFSLNSSVIECRSHPYVSHTWNADLDNDNCVYLSFFLIGITADSIKSCCRIRCKIVCVSAVRIVSRWYRLCVGTYLISGHVCLQDSRAGNIFVYNLIGVSTCTRLFVAYWLFSSKPVFAYLIITRVY